MPTTVENQPNTPSVETRTSGPAVVVCGTLALDVIGRYDGQFSASTPGAMPSQSVRLADLHVEFGGCAMNIAYSLALLGAKAYPVVRVGRDYDGAYAAHVRALGIEEDGILVDPAFANSSYCIVLGDGSGKQLTAFYPGSSDAAATARMPHHDAGALATRVAARYAVVAPDVQENMLRHLDALARSSTPTLVDPGQGLADFDAEGARALVERSRALIVNRAEWQALQAKTTSSATELRARLDWLVVTDGERGLTLYRDGDALALPAIHTADAIDHTGCGDALRAGLAFGLARGATLDDALRLGILLATINLESVGCQRHRVTREALATRYRASWQREWLW